MTRYVVFDTETTGLSPSDGHRIIEIGCVELIEGAPTGRSFHTYCRPHRPVDPGAVAVHGITDEFLLDHPEFGDDRGAARLIDFFGEARLIAHNAPFDVRFLDAEFARIGRPGIDQGRVIDTLEIARRKFPGARNDLDSLCDRFRISRKARAKHGALIDAELTASVFIELTGGLQRHLSLQADAEARAERAEKETEGPFARAKNYPVRDTGHRATEEDRARHAAFIEALGADSIWSTLEKTGG